MRIHQKLMLECRWLQDEEFSGTVKINPIKDAAHVSLHEKFA